MVYFSIIMLILTAPIWLFILYFSLVIIAFFLILPWLVVFDVCGFSWADDIIQFFINLFPGD